jgi:hypothetical protein
MTITSGTGLSWDDREVKRSLIRELSSLGILLIIGLYYPIVLLVGSSAILFTIISLPLIRNARERRALGNSPWLVIDYSDISYIKDDEFSTLQCRGVGGHRHIIGLDLDSTSPRLLGNMSALVRSMDVNDGFCLTISMHPEKIDSVLDSERLVERMEIYLDTLSRGALSSYVVAKGGIWSVRVSLIGHARDEHVSHRFESSVRGAIPEPAWTAVSPADLENVLLRKQIRFGNPSFYGSGKELSEWLVQLPSELAPEVGSNVPGEFIAPIRPRPGDYELGVVVNPETLQEGPVAGISHSDLESGLLICGGDLEERRHVLGLLTASLLDTGKRVLIISSKRTSLDLAALVENAIGLELGKDLILNPVDAEGIPRHIYVPKLLNALEVVAGADLRGAADFEIALSRAVALGNTTVADIRMQGSDEPGDAFATNVQGSNNDPSPSSLAGMEAIRRLHQGTAARAFYGSQTAKMSDLAQSPLSIISVDLGTSPLQKFAFDLICIKLAGLARDPSLVVILEDAENLRIRNRRYMKRDAWSERMVRDLKDRGPLVVALDHPVDMAPGAIGRLTSCISLRLREAPDIKVAVELLGINVVSSGMHSKARQSSRETSYLRVMPDGVALLVRTPGETCMPIRLRRLSVSLAAPSSEELRLRASQLIQNQDSSSSLSKDGSLLERVGRGDQELAVMILKLLERYEPLTQEAVQRFISTSGFKGDPDVEGVLARLEHSSMVLRGHEVHSGVSYTNYRMTMKGKMALKQIQKTDGDA